MKAKEQNSNGHRRRLTVQPRSHGDQDHRYAPVPQEGAEPRRVAVPHLLESQFVCDRVLDDQDVGLLQDFAHAGPVAVQQVLEGGQTHRVSAIIFTS